MKLILRNILYAIFIILSTTFAMSNELPKIKYVAVLLPLSGQNSKIGQSLINAVEMAWFEYAPATIKMKLYDTKSSNVETINAYEQAIKNGAKIIIGPLSGTNTNAIRSHSVSGIPVLSLSNNSDASSENIYTTGFTPVSQGKAIGQILEYLNIERAVLFLPENKLGSAIEEGIASTFFSRIVETIYYKTNNADYSDQIKTLVKNKEYINYDAIIIPDGNARAIRTLSSQLSYFDALDILNENGEITKEKVRIIGGLGWQGLGSPHKEPALLNGYYLSIPNNTQTKKFRENYKKLYNQQAPLIAELAYDMTALAITAITAENLQDKLMQENGFKGISGIFKMDTYGTVIRTYNINKIYRHRSGFVFSSEVPSK